jgi:hypothetical protein
VGLVPPTLTRNGTTNDLGDYRVGDLRPAATYFARNCEPRRTTLPTRPCLDRCQPTIREHYSGARLTSSSSGAVVG